jgi:hypothetical protein
VRLLRSFAFAAALLLFPSTSRAEKPAADRGAALVTGAAVFVVGFAVGGMLVATARDDRQLANAGWLTMESSFALAPLASHAMVGEWGRGLAWTAAPAAMVGGTGALFAYDPGTIAGGSLVEQRWLWSFFSLGLASGTAGLLDVLWSGRRSASVSITPSVGAGHFSLDIQGEL